MSHELQENVARQRLTQRMLQARGDIVRQLQAAANKSGSVDESTFGQVLAASGVQMSSADRSWFWNAMSGGQCVSPAVIAVALENLQVPIEEAGALLDGPSAQRPHLRTALGRGLVNYNDAGEVNVGEENESMGKSAATKAFAAQRVKDALLTELPKVSRLFQEAPNGLSFSDFFHGLAASGVRLSQAELDQLQALWVQAYKRAEYLANGTATDVFVFPKKWGGEELSTPVNIITQELCNNLRRCLVHDDVAKSITIQEFQRAKDEWMCNTLNEVYDEMELWQWNEVQHNRWARALKASNQVGVRPMWVCR